MRSQMRKLPRDVVVVVTWMRERFERKHGGDESGSTEVMGGGIGHGVNIRIKQFARQRRSQLAREKLFGEKGSLK